MHQNPCHESFSIASQRERPSPMTRRGHDSLCNPSVRNAKEVDCHVGAAHLLRRLSSDAGLDMRRVLERPLSTFHDPADPLSSELNPFSSLRVSERRRLLRRATRPVWEPDRRCCVGSSCPDSCSPFGGDIFHRNLSDMTEGMPPGASYNPTGMDARGLSARCSYE